MITIRQIKNGDLEIVMADPYQDEVKDYPELIVPETSFAGELNGELLGIGGVIDKGDGVCEAWLMLTKKMDKGGTSGIRAFHAIRKKLNELSEPFDRCDALVRDDFPKAKAMIEALGYAFVETKIQLPPMNIDMHLYSKKIQE